MNMQIPSVMPDYGGGPYLWILRDGTPDRHQVGPNIASYEYWPDEILHDLEGLAGEGQFSILIHM